MKDFIWSWMTPRIALSLRKTFGVEWTKTVTHTHTDENTTQMEKGHKMPERRERQGEKLEKKPVAAD